jgi:hypothetical protein
LLCGPPRLAIDHCSPRSPDRTRRPAGAKGLQGRCDRGRSPIPANHPGGRAVPSTGARCFRPRASPTRTPSTGARACGRPASGQSAGQRPFKPTERRGAVEARVVGVPSNRRGAARDSSGARRRDGRVGRSARRARRGHQAAADGPGGHAGAGPARRTGSGGVAAGGPRARAAAARCTRSPVPARPRPPPPAPAPPPPQDYARSHDLTQDQVVALLDLSDHLLADSNHKVGSPGPWGVGTSEGPARSRSAPARAARQALPAAAAAPPRCGTRPGRPHAAPPPRTLAPFGPQVALRTLSVWEAAAVRSGSAVKPYVSKLLPFVVGGTAAGGHGSRRRGTRLQREEQRRAAPTLGGQSCGGPQDSPDAAAAPLPSPPPPLSSPLDAGGAPGR